MSNTTNPPRPANSAEAMFWGEPLKIVPRTQHPPAPTATKPAADREPEWRPRSWRPPVPEDLEQFARDQRRSGAIVMMVPGMLLAAFGIVLTAGTFDAAVSHGGGTYVIAY